jgi:hypothetical protein
MQATRNARSKTSYGSFVSMLPPEAKGSIQGEISTAPAGCASPASRSESSVPIARPPPAESPATTMCAGGTP